jgi:hypothetical protein
MPIQAGPMLSFLISAASEEFRNPTADFHADPGSGQMLSFSIFAASEEFRNPTAALHCQGIPACDSFPRDAARWPNLCLGAGRFNRRSNDTKTRTYEKTNSRTWRSAVMKLLVGLATILIFAQSAFAAVAGHAATVTYTDAASVQQIRVFSRTSNHHLAADAWDGVGLV